MASPRIVTNPVVKTYIVPSRTLTGVPIHVRIYAPKFGLDKRGTGLSLSDARKHALHGIPPTTRAKKKP